MDVTSTGPQGQSESVSGRALPVEQPALSSIRTGVRKAGSGVGPEGPAPSILIHEVISVADRLEHGEMGRFSQKLARLAGHVERSQKFARWLEKIEPRRAEKLSGCGTWLMFREYYEMEGKPRKLAGGIFCQQPLWCTFCAAGRSARQSAALSQKVAEILRQHPHLVPYAFTLTMKNQRELKPMLDQMWGGWGKLVQRRRNALAGRTYSPTAKWVAGFASGEVKRGENSREWHSHIHGLALIERGRWNGDKDFRALVQDWAGCIGQGWANCFFRPVKNYRLGGLQTANAAAIGKAVCETIKYAIKPDAKMPFKDMREAALALHRVKRLRCFGKLQGCPLPEAVTDDLTEYEGQAFREICFQYFNGSYQPRQTIDEAQREPVFDDWNQGLI